MQRELLGNVHPDVAFTLNNLAWVAYGRGDVREALKFEEESLKIYRVLFPGDNPDVARTMNRLGYLVMETGDYSTADTYLQDALKMRRRLFGEAHPEVASSLVHVAILQVATHRYAEALLSAHAAMDMFTKSLSADNWKTAVAESVSGAALAGLGRFSEAEGELLQAYTVLTNDAGALPMYRTLARRYLDELHRLRPPGEATHTVVPTVRTAAYSLEATKPPVVQPGR